MWLPECSVAETRLRIPGATPAKGRKSVSLFPIAGREDWMLAFAGMTLTDLLSCFM